MDELQQEVSVVVSKHRRGRVADPFNDKLVRFATAPSVSPTGDVATGVENIQLRSGRCSICNGSTHVSQ